MTVESLLADEKLLKSYKNALRKAMETVIWTEYTTTLTATNPYSGVQVELNPVEASIYAWCMQWYRNYEHGDMLTPIQTYDNMRYLFLHLNPNAYYDLLD